MSNLQPKFNSESQNELEADAQTNYQPIDNHSANLEHDLEHDLNNGVEVELEEQEKANKNTEKIPEKKTKKIPVPNYVPKGYVIVRYLGSGQTADVFLASHRQFGEVALKLIRPEIKGIYAHTHMFTNEVFLTTRLRHPFVINAYDGDPTENNAYLALEHCAGGTLDGYLNKHGQFDLQETYKLILQIASGLSFTHTRGILHRDVKPANILLKANGDARIADFGTGVYIDKIPKDEKVGTAYYMAPEIFKGGIASVQSDIYSLGVLAYELLTARRPFQGRTYNQLMQAHLSKVPPNPKHLRKDLDASVAFAIMKALSGSSEKRYETVLQFKNAIQKAVKVDISELEDAPIQVGRKSRASGTEKTTDGEGPTIEVTPAEKTTRKSAEHSKPQGFIRRLFSKKSK